MHHPLARCTERGSSSTEQALMLSVVMVAIVAAGQLFVGIFQSGVQDMSQDVVRVLTGRGGEDGPSGPPIEYSGGGGGYEGGSGGSGGGGSGGGGSGDGGSSDGGSSDGGSSDGGSSGDGGSSSDGGSSDGGGGASTEAPSEDESTCPYVYDEASERWRDPETGQYVSGAAAAQAGC